MLEQEGYQWYDDNGSQASATAKAAQDASIAVPLDKAVRLRFLVNSSASAPAVSAYRLEYRESAQTDFSPVLTDVGAIIMAPSSFITASGEATTARLTPPSGKSAGGSFTTGRIWDDENGNDSVVFSANQYTELEWCIKANSSAASLGQAYTFRVAYLPFATAGGIQSGQSAKGSTTSDTSVSTSATAAPTTTGSTFIVAILADGSSTIGTPTDNKSNAYTVVGTGMTAAGMNFGVFACTNGTGGAGHTASASLGAIPFVGTIFLHEVLNAATTNSIDTGSVGTSSIPDSSSPFTATTGTLAQAAELVVAILQSDSGSNPATLAESSGFTIQVKEEDGSTVWIGGIATKVVSSTSAVSCSFTQSGSTNGLVKIFGVKQ